MSAHQMSVNSSRRADINTPDESNAPACRVRTRNPDTSQTRAPRAERDAPKANRPSVFANARRGGLLSRGTRPNSGQTFSKEAFVEPRGGSPDACQRVVTRLHMPSFASACERTTCARESTLLLQTLQHTRSPHTSETQACQKTQACALVTFFPQITLSTTRAGVRNGAHVELEDPKDREDDLRRALSEKRCEVLPRRRGGISIPCLECRGPARGKRHDRANLISSREPRSETTRRLPPGKGLTVVRLSSWSVGARRASP